MGKGTIVSGGDDGLYNVELKLKEGGVQDQIDTLNDQIAEIEDAITDAENEITQLESDISSLEAELALLEPSDEWDAKHDEIIIAQRELAGKISYRDVLELKKTSCEKQIEYLQGHMPEDPTVSAWCGDLTEDLSGDVGTIEIPGERSIVQIQPGYDNNAVYNTERDGQLQPAIAGTPAGTFFNLAILPGWQKWFPTYRHGIISNIDADADTCDVELDVVESSQQGLVVVPFDRNLLNIPIEYPDCNSGAFGDGDNVLVKFEGQEWSGAKVIGFKDNPKGCTWEPWGATVCANNDWWVGMPKQKCRDDLMGDNWTSLNLSEPPDGNYIITGNQPIQDDWGREYSHLTANPAKLVSYVKIKLNAISCIGYSGSYSRQSHIWVQLSALDNISDVKFVFAYSGSFTGYPAKYYDVSYNDGSEIIFNLADYGIITPCDVKCIQLFARGESGYGIDDLDHVPYGFHYTCDYIHLY